MEQFSGKTVFSGIAFAKTFLFVKPELSVDTSPIKDDGASADAEMTAFRKAIKTADDQLSAISEKTEKELGHDEAMIVEVQRVMLQDVDFLAAVEAFIRGESNRAAYAVERTGRKFYDQFAALDDPYMKARAADVADISHRLTAIILGEKTDFALSVPSIILAEDLCPSDTLTMEKSLVRAFVTRKGSVNSHSAILARTLKIPSIVQADIPLDRSMDGREAAVDASADGLGRVYIEPDKALAAALEAKLKKAAEDDAALEALRELPAVTKGGRRITLAANIGGVDDIDAALAAGADGIGLFRSEFLFLGRKDYPREDEQADAYKKAAQAFNGKRVVIRTLDIGADKRAGYLGLEDEENPALGCRAIRICFERPAMFKTQLRAIYRASAFGKIAVMFPMVTSLWELRRCREFAAEARNELAEEGIPFSNIELGIMVETPAAALCARELAAEADFFSVGTNDLTQYTLAIDRQNSRLEPFLDTRHPALLRLLEMIAAGAREAGISAGVCGELAADPEMTEKFLAMGYDELSVSPAFIPHLRKKIRSLPLGMTDDIIIPKGSTDLANEHKSVLL